jgi:MFS transporter, MHS family, shikimate and dehydroshikimate transport protein
MAPVLLLFLRILQGIGIGGEWGGAVVMAIEHAPPGKRSFYGSYPQIGVPAGLMASAGVVAILNQLPADAFLTWGWRVAFLLSAVLVVVGLFIRLKISETPEFTLVKEQGREVAVPVGEMFMSYPREIIQTLGARFIEGASFNMFGVFIIAYGVGTLHLSRGFVLNGVIIASGLMIPLIFYFGSMADRIGLRRMFGIGSICVGIATAASFFVMQNYAHQYPYLVWLAIIVPLSLAYPMVYGPESSLFATQFDARVRYTGVSFAYQFSGIFASGLTPIIATLLLERGGGKPWLIVAYMSVVSLISLVSVVTMQIPNPKVEAADGQLLGARADELVGRDEAPARL